MWILAHLLALQWSLAAAGLCLAWRWRYLRTMRIVLAAIGVPLFQAVATWAMLPLWPHLVLPTRAMLVALPLLSAAVWFSYAWNERTYHDFPVGKRRRMLWLMVGLAVQLTSVAFSALLLGQWFIARDGYHPIPSGWLTVSLGGAMVTGGFLSATAVYGWLSGARGKVGEGQDLLFERLRLFRAVEWLETGLVLRAVAIALSLGMGAGFSTFGAPRFYQRLIMWSLVNDEFIIHWPPHYALQWVLLLSSNLLVLRLLVGLVLPLLQGWLLLFALRGKTKEASAGQFLPVLIMILLGEILAAGLTVGMAGIAF